MTYAYDACPSCQARKKADARACRPCTDAERNRRSMATLPHRLFARVEKTDTCWNWTGTAAHDYGQIYTPTNRKARAHRVAYELFVGPIPKGYEVDHLCYNRRCVNPAHLEAVTGAENRRRAVARRWRRPVEAAAA